MRNKHTLITYAIQKVGFTKAQTCVRFIAMWAIMEASLGRPARTFAEFEQWWEMSEAAVYRSLRQFRAVFPDYVTPSELLAIIHPAPIRAAKSQQMEVMLDLITVPMPYSFA